MGNFRNLEAKSLERMEKLLVSVSILDESLKLYEENLDKTMKAVTEKIDPDDWRYYAAEIYSEYHEVQEELPIVIQHSVLVHVYSIFESILNKLCAIHKREKSLAISLADLKHDGILRAKIYIKKVSCSEFPDNSKEWPDILLINKIRNIIVHSDSHLSKEKHPDFENIKKYIEETEGLRLSENSDIVISNNYIKFTINTFKIFLTELFKCQRKEFN